MRRVVSVAITAIMLCAVGWAQTSMSPAMQNAPARKSTLAEYAGSWIGMFQGHTWLTIRLTPSGDQLTGTLQRAQDVKFDNKGDVESVSADKWSGSFESVQLSGDGLLLTVKNPGTQATDRYIMRLTHNTVAEVQMAMFVPPPMPRPKPWKLMKVGPTAVTPVR